ncbi:hypothetical protein KXD40_002159 [Peronospora effusa]|uniref:Uncharacterized protein n=1 Tax=Peronospora effusa TaxID=542832 RepID=A0A3M6V8V0_9STRA|nr:hypothetical protein DD238_007798 [Peronospora effusa]UIZ26919.1 hypothetical protein KXD40_002172 [Peronospora effusa]UIZ26947.1 hypothetical protein KXD40_002159 [Peronospora effusa]
MARSVRFAVQRCKALKGINIPEEFIRQQDISKKLLLNGYQYRDINADVQDAGNIAGSGSEV